MTHEPAYELILGCLNDPNKVNGYKADPDGTIRQAGITDPHDADQLKWILNLIGLGYLAQNSSANQMYEMQKRTLEVAQEMQEGLKQTVRQIDEAFRVTMNMYQVSFYLGVVLIVVAVAVALIPHLAPNGLLPSVFGSLGILDILTFFLAKPQEALQSSRANLVQLQAALYSWYSDIYNLNSALALFQQQGTLDQANMLSISEKQMEHTERTLAMLQKYCTLTKSAPAQPSS